MKSSLEGLKIEDFSCTFESQGNSFLFEDIVALYYMTEENLILSDGRKMPVFVSKQALEKMRKMGETRTSEETLRTIRTLSGLVDKAWDDARTYRERTKLTKRDASNAFALLEAVCKEYSYFEPYYWDGAYEKAKTDADMKKSIALVQDFKNEVRARLNRVFFEKDGLLDVLVSAIAKQFDILVDDILCHRIGEILALFNAKKVLQEVLDARRKSYVLYMDKSHSVHLVAGAEAQGFIESFTKDSADDRSIITGKIAHGKGIVRGKVKIVSRDYANPELTKKRIVSMKQGYILVSETTDPEMMLALEKAAAIVTDVGGMLSHAAITARELDIPCIVGTGRASKVLKDEDTVEVDADKGTITIVK